MVRNVTQYTDVCEDKVKESRLTNNIQLISNVTSWSVTKVDTAPVDSVVIFTNVG